MLQCSVNVLAVRSAAEIVVGLKLETCCLAILALGHLDMLFDCPIISRVEEGAKIFGCLMDIERQLRD